MSWEGLNPCQLALGAAAQAAEAVPALMHFARHSEPGELFVPGENEPVEKLADALKMTLEAMGEAGARDEHGQLLAACYRFLDGWAG